ncbi:MAG: response regulator transcription factor [Anaerolineae bacterium]|nr:response regulator transcription factor [Anaerolineae bacterium]
MAQIKVLVVEGQALLREGLCALLAAQGDFVVVGDAGDAATAAQLAGMRAPDVIVTDLRLPDAGGAEIVTRLLAARAAAHIVAFTALEDDETAAAAVAAGAQGYVLKHRPAADLLRAIREVAGGGIWLDPAIVPAIWRRFQQLARHNPQEAPELLSAFEQDVLDLMAVGKNTQQIAAALTASAATVERTIGRVCTKLGGRNRAHAVTIALQRGLLRSRQSERRVGKK